MKHSIKVFALTLALSLAGLSPARFVSNLASGELATESVEANTNPQATEIKCGDVLRITHVATGAHLHSHPINYEHPHTSGQQQVTAYKGTDYNDLWIVRSPCTNPVKNGDRIRLEHAATKRYLHSHPNIPAPVTTYQQEVTGWGGGDTTDNNDLWKVEVEGGGVWTTDKQVRLIHVATNAALHSHPNISHIQWTTGQQEVTAYAGRDQNDFWKAATTSEPYPNTNPLDPGPNPRSIAFPIKLRGDKVFENGAGADWVVEVQISNNGRIDMFSNIKAHRSLDGWCGRYAVYLLDGAGNVLGRYGMGPDHQWCVDGRLVPGGKHERNDEIHQDIPQDVLNKIRSVAIAQTSTDGKNVFGLKTIKDLVEVAATIIAVV